MAARTLALAADQAHKQKMEKLKSLIEQTKAREQDCQDKLQELQHQLAQWRTILNFITSMETHGTLKPANMSWVDYFRQANVGLEEFPPMFAGDLAFDECLLLVTKLMGDLSDAVEHKLKTLETYGKRVASHEKSSSRLDNVSLDKLTKAKDPDAREAELSFGICTTGFHIVFTYV